MFFRSSGEFWQESPYTLRKPPVFPVQSPQMGCEAMNFAAVVAEYNPFHNGHRYQLEEIRRRGATHIAVVMSGNVVQRAEVASFHKLARAKAAVLSGADLVVELPVLYACASAEGFAGGAVQTLAGLGIPGTLCFGSECGDLSALETCADTLGQIDGSPELRGYLDRGYAFAAARSQALADICGPETAAILRNPNDTLAVEYLRAIRRTGAAFVPAAIRRAGTDHHSLSPSGSFASATMLRQQARQYGVGQLRPFVPESAYELYRREYALGRGGASMCDLEQVILYHLRTLSASQLAELPDVQEGLEHRFRAAAFRVSTLEELLMEVKSKRYAMSRIKRILMCATLGITREDAAQKPGYLRVLAFNQRGRELLRAAKKSGTLPIYHSFADLERDFPVHARKEALASSLFAAALPRARGGFSEYRDAGPVFVREGINESSFGTN